MASISAINKSIHNIGLKGLIVSILSLSIAVIVEAASIERSIGGDPDRPIIIGAVPEGNQLAWAVEEQLPIGTVATDISHHGVFDHYTGKVKWGPFTDASSRDLSYRLVSVDSGEIALTGRVSWDGSLTETIPGIESYAATGAGYNGWLLGIFGSGSIGKPETFPSNDGDLDGIPLLAEYYFGLDPLQKDRPHLRISQLSTGNAKLSLTRRTSATDVDARFLQSTDLANWSTIDPGVPDSLITLGELETLSFDLSYQQAMSYWRLQFEQQ